jgi:beta-galactosidase
VRHGVNVRGHAVHYYLNYSGARQEFVYPYVVGKERLKETPVATEAKVALEPWGVAIIEEDIGRQ